MYREELVKKTRNQSLFEFLEALQLEYIQGEIRLKIYPKAKDKKFWKKVLSHKESKIKDIAKRNNLPHIFDEDGSSREGYLEKVVCQTGIPSFVYKDDEDEAEFRAKDFKYYFNRGAEVRVLVGDGQMEIGVINTTPALGSTVIELKIRGQHESSVHDINYVTRIL